MCKETLRVSSDVLNRACWGSALVAFAVLFPRVGVAQQSTAARAEVSVAGCYRMSLGPWSRESNLGPRRPTTVFRLDTIPFRHGLPDDLVAERVEPTEGALPGDVRAKWTRPALWRRVGADSVEIIAWSTGFEAEVFYGHWAGSTLQGFLRRTSDALPMDPVTGQIKWNAWPHAAASAVRTTCP